MDFTKSIDYNGFSVNDASFSPDGVPTSGFRVEEINVSDEDVAAYAEKRAIADGIDASDVYLGRRLLAATVTVFGSSRGDFWDKQQDLLANFSPTVAYNADTANLGFLPFNFFQPTADISTWPESAYPDGIPMRYYVRPARTPQFIVRRDEVGGEEAQGLSLPYRLSLVARDPRKYLQDATSISIASGTATASSSVAYAGDYPTGRATVTINSSSATGTATYAIEAGQFALTIDATSATYEIDLGRRSMTKNGVNAMNLLTWANDIWPVIGLNTPVTVTRVSATCPTSLFLNFRQAFA